MLTLMDGVALLPCGRRDFLRIGGGLALAGLTLPSLRAGPAAPRRSAQRRHEPRQARPRRASWSTCSAGRPTSTCST